MNTLYAVITASCEPSGLHCTRFTLLRISEPSTWKDDVSNSASWSGDDSSTRPEQPPGKRRVQPAMGSGMRLVTMLSVLRRKSMSFDSSVANLLRETKHTARAEPPFTTGATFSASKRWEQVTSS